MPSGYDAAGCKTYTSPVKYGLPFLSVHQHNGMSWVSYTIQTGRSSVMSGNKVSVSKYVIRFDEDTGKFSDIFVFPCPLKCVFIYFKLMTQDMSLFRKIRMRTVWPLTWGRNHETIPAAAKTNVHVPERKNLKEYMRLFKRQTLISFTY